MLDVQDSVSSAWYACVLEAFPRNALRRMNSGPPNLLLPLAATSCCLYLHRRDISPPLARGPKPGANTLRGTNSSAASTVAYQQTGESRGAGARAAGQTNTVGLCHIACSSNIGYWAKSTVADPPALTVRRRAQSKEDRRHLKVWGSEPTDSTIDCDKTLNTDRVHLGPVEGSQSPCVKVDLTTFRTSDHLRDSSAGYDPARSSSQEDSQPATPLFPCFLMAHLLSQTPVCMVQSHLEVFKCSMPFCSGNV